MITLIQWIREFAGVNASTALRLKHRIRQDTLDEVMEVVSYLVKGNIYGDDEDSISRSELVGKIEQLKELR